MSAARRPARRPRRPSAAARQQPTKGALRVVAGSAGGRRIDVPAGTATRPTSDRVREALFNALDSLDVVEGAAVLDGFAGSGALGIEALSRGADHATFCETDPAASTVVTDNLRGLGLSARATVLTAPVERQLAARGPFGLVLLDPPYAYERWPQLLDDVAAHLVPDGVVVVESDHEVALPPSLRGIRVKTYGSTVVQFATIAGAPS